MLVALALIVLIGVMGLAIDVGYLRYMKRQIQSAADAAAMSAALELSSCGTGCTTSIQTAAETASKENGFTNGEKGVTIDVHNPPAAGDPYSADPNADKVVEVVVSQPEPVHFASIFGWTSATVSARADGKASSSINCVYSLTSLNLLVGTVAAPNCGLIVEGTLGCAAGSITASRIGVAGSSGGLLCATTPAPIPIGVPNPPDPLAYLPAPLVGPCGSGLAGNTYNGSMAQALVTGGTFTFNPGVYCGGISITAGTAFFNPGTYVLNSGGLSISAGAVSVNSGSPGGVTFYNTGTGTITMNFAVLNQTVNLNAPTSGAYEGVLFFQDPANTMAASFNVSVAGMNLAGAYYFPNAPINFFAAVDFGAGAPYTILDAQSISFGLGTIGFTINSDYSSLPDGSPIKGGAVLVE